MNSSENEYVGCGGGYLRNINTNEFVEEADENKTCIDATYWTTVNKRNCSYYDDATSTKCHDFGYLENSITGESANDVCRVCGGGYRDGNLTGLKLRAGYSPDIDSLYVIYTLSDNTTRGGSVVDYAHEISNMFGFGLYPVSNYSHNAWAQHPENEWERCIYDVQMGNLDICIGPYWKTLSRGNPADYTMNVFTNSLVMIVPLEEETWLESMFAVGETFTERAWIAILFMIFYMGFVLNIVTKNNNDEEDADRSLRGHAARFERSLRSICYMSIRSFVSGDAVNGTDDPSRSEQLIVVGFVVSLF